MTVDQWLRSCSEEFADAMVPTARLDAEVILAHTINKPRTWLHAHGEEELDPRRRDIADARAELRLERVPVAYIIGHKEFYGRRFAVSPDILIPRPESEVLIELVKHHLPRDAKRLVDVGTGSGCLGITAKLELPELSVTLTDISKKALLIAQKNASTLGAEVRILESDLVASYPLRADVVIANLPYVDVSWPDTSPELANEPAEALYAKDGGLALIYTLFDTVNEHITPSAIIVLEADPRQHEDIIKYAKSAGFELIETDGFGIVFRVIR